MVELLMHRFLLKKGQIIENKLTFEAKFVLNTLECMLEVLYAFHVLLNNELITPNICFFQPFALEILSFNELYYV